MSTVLANKICLNQESAFKSKVRIYSTYYIVSSADTICKQFRPRSDPTKRGADLDGFPEGFFKFAKVDFEKNQQTTKKEKRSFASLIPRDIIKRKTQSRDKHF